MNDRGPLQSIPAAGEQLAPAIARHIDRTFRDAMHGPGVVIESRFVRLLTGEPHPFGNIVLVAPPCDLPAAQEALRPLCETATPAVIFFAGRVDRAVEDYVRGRGFEHPEPMIGMAVEIDRLAATDLPPGYEFVGVGGLEGEAWGETLAAGYEFPAAVGRAFAPTAAGPAEPGGASMQFFAVRRQGRFVATSMLYMKDDLAGIYCVSTIPAERGKRLAAHATAEPLRQARERGYRVGILQATAAGYPVYQRLGFSDRGCVPAFVRLGA